MSTQTVLFPAAAHNPGGKVSLDLPAGMTGDALFGGPNQEYRYWLERVWDKSLPTLFFCMMNPSVGSAQRNDPTVAKLCRYAMTWGYGRLVVGNIFAYRSTSPENLLRVADPVGPENDRWLLKLAAEAQLIVMAYGLPPKQLRARGPQVASMLRARGHTLHVLSLCFDGTPRHPLYLRDDLKPQLWSAAA